MTHFNFSFIHLKKRYHNFIKIHGMIEASYQFKLFFNLFINFHSIINVNLMEHYFDKEIFIFQSLF